MKIIKNLRTKKKVDTVPARLQHKNVLSKGSVYFLKFPKSPQNVLTLMFFFTFAKKVRQHYQNTLLK